MREKVEVLKCDGTHKGPCGRVVKDREDGIVVRGALLEPSGGQLVPAPSPMRWAGTGVMTPPVVPAHAEHVLCWRCFEVVTGRPPRVEVKYETRYEYRESDSGGGSGGPTGPLPPPELGHPVRFARALAGVRDE